MSKGRRIKERRKFLNISQTDLAKRIHISKQSLYKYENGIVTNIPSDVIEDLSMQLKCSPGYLMGWDKEPGEYYLDSSAQLINKYNRLNNEGRKQLIDYADFLLSKEEYKKDSQGQAIS